MGIKGKRWRGSVEQFAKLFHSVGKKKIQYGTCLQYRKTSLALLLGLCTSNAWATQGTGNDLVYSTPDGKKLAVDRVEMATMAPDQKALFEETFTDGEKPEAIDIDRGPRGVSNTSSLPAGRKLIITKLDVTFEPIEDGGFYPEGESNFEWDSSYQGVHLRRIKPVLHEQNVQKVLVEVEIGEELENVPEQYLTKNSLNVLGSSGSGSMAGPQLRTLSSNGTSVGSTRKAGTLNRSALIGNGTKANASQIKNQWTNKTVSGRFGCQDPWNLKKMHHKEMVGYVREVPFKLKYKAKEHKKEFGVGAGKFGFEATIQKAVSLKYTKKKYVVGTHNYKSYPHSQVFKSWTKPRIHGDEVLHDACSMEYASFSYKQGPEVEFKVSFPSPWGFEAKQTKNGIEAKIGLTWGLKYKIAAYGTSGFKTVDHELAEGNLYTGAGFTQEVSLWAEVGIKAKAKGVGLGLAVETYQGIGADFRGKQYDRYDVDWYCRSSNVMKHKSTYGTWHIYTFRGLKFKVQIIAWTAEFDIRKTFTIVKTKGKVVNLPPIVNGFGDRYM